jgi:hypothetical protein
MAHLETEGMDTKLMLSNTLLSELVPTGSFSKEALEKISRRLPELDRGKRSCGRTNSQTCATLQTMTMLADSPYRQLQQCLVQIDNKKEALVEIYWNVQKDKIKIKRWEESDDEFQHIEAKAARAETERLRSSCEQALKEIGIYQDIYDQVRKAHNIPEKWDEEDFEKHEISNAIRMSFRHAIQNILATGTVAKSTSEYWEQFGIHPMIGERMTREYMGGVQKELDENRVPSVTNMHEFLDRMCELFKDEHKHSLKRIGIDAIVNHQYIYKEKK